MSFRKIYEKIKYKIKKFYCVLTSPIRTLPTFIIIGASRSGTSSLYFYLSEHPYIKPSLRKELHYFDRNFKVKSLNWYRAFFPIRCYKYFMKHIYKRDFATFEATPFYLLHPHAAKRIFSTIPNVKLIILLRNPVDRAYSHYYRIRNKLDKKGLGRISFEEIVKRSKEKLKRGEFVLWKDEDFKEFYRYSNLIRGIYIDQIKKWCKYFPKEQMLIIKSEDLFKNTSNTLKTVYHFLNLPNWKNKEYRKHLRKRKSLH